MNEDFVLVCSLLKYKDRTLYLAIHFLDMMLVQSDISISHKNQTELFIACLLISSKLEEVYFLSLKQLQQILKIAICPNNTKTVESEILNRLEFRLCPLLLYDFIEVGSCLLNLSLKEYIRLRYFAELCIQINLRIPKHKIFTACLLMTASSNSKIETKRRNYFFSFCLKNFSLGKGECQILEQICTSKIENLILEYGLQTVKKYRQYLQIVEDEDFDEKSLEKRILDED